jgi:hypothetical protein
MEGGVSRLRLRRHLNWLLAEPGAVGSRAVMRRRPFLVASLVAAAAFALHATLFLYFFVDDEAIPLIYARNLLRGRGLIYTSLEGRVEGYSDFLHVLWSAVLLGITGRLGFSPLAPLAIGKAVSFMAGAGVVLVAARTMRHASASTPGLVAGLAFLALAGPLALWSCSSLETAVFALAVTALASVLFIDSAGDTSIPAHLPRNRIEPRLALATVLGVVVILERIDGFIYVGALIAAGLAGSGPSGRRYFWRLSWRLALAAVLFHGWRYAYFGSLLSTPLEVKVLHQFFGPANAFVRAQDESYLRSFLDLYGVGALPVLALTALGAWYSRPARAAAVALLLLGTYVGVVGDWMFGWRFTVALLPLAAVVIALAVTRIPGRAAWVAAAVVMLWSGAAAATFVTAYKNMAHWPIFWTEPRAAGTSAWVRPYGDLLDAARGLLRAGDRVAYNQAGILTYMFDLENIDDLGLCSRFVARLPTSDIEYTSVGRHSPLRNQPVLYTAHAYVLYRNVRFLVTRTNLLQAANGGQIPNLLLGGYFRHVMTDASGTNAIYARTEKSAIAYQEDPARFTENLAHTSRLVGASIEAEQIEPRDFYSRFPFLRERHGRLPFDTATQLNLVFGAEDEEVAALYIRRVTVSSPATMTIALFDGDGREVARKEIEMITSRRRSVFERFDPRIRARAISIGFTTKGGGGQVMLDDVRVEGQSGALREYVRQNLQFPAP